MSMPISPQDRFVNLLLEKKLINDESLKKAQEEAKKKGAKLTETILEMGLISKSNYLAILSEEFGYPAIDISKFKLQSDILKMVPKKLAKQYKIIPVSKMGNMLTVAMADPLNVIALDDLRALTNCVIGAVIANEKDITNAIAEYYEGQSHQDIENLVGGMQASDNLDLLEDTKESSVSGSDLMRITQEAPIVKLANTILIDGVKMRASDILIEPLEDEMRVRFRVDGILVEGKRMPKKVHSAVVSRLKVMSNMNIAERRLPQDGRFKIKLQEREIDFRVSILPSNIGEKAALRVLDKSQAMLDIDALGFDEKPLNDIKKMSGKPHGMILACGPTGCGKTTTLYSILKHVDKPTENIITVEDPVEFQLPGINQVTAVPEIGLTFAGALRSILRQDPDIIMIGEIRDFETVDIAIKAALTGHLVLSTLHTTTASGSIVRLVNMGVEPFLITSSLLLVISQRLARKSCPACKEPVKLNPELARSFGLNSDVTVYRAKGCKICQKSGYKGRIGLIETLVLTQTIRDLILERKDEHIITEAAVKEGMETLRMNAIKKMQAGIISPEEVLRLTASEQVDE